MTKWPTSPEEIRQAVREHGLHQLLEEANHGVGSTKEYARRLISEFAVKLLRQPILDRCNPRGLDRSDVMGLYSEVVCRMFEGTVFDCEEAMVRWLARSLANRVIDELRSMVGRGQTKRTYVEFQGDRGQSDSPDDASSDSDVQGSHSHGTPETLFQKESEAVLVHMAILEVSCRGPVQARQMAAVVLCEMQGLSTEEACWNQEYRRAAGTPDGQAGKCSPELVRQDLVRGKKALREYLALKRLGDDHAGGRL